MDNLPQDPIMLTSCINMLLRDKKYDSLESLCAYYDKDINQVKNYLKKYGFEYMEELKQFR